MNLISRLGVSRRGHPIRLQSRGGPGAAERSGETLSSADQPAEGASLGTLVEHAGQFISDFARYSGRKTYVAGTLVALSGLLEGVGLFLLIPILAIVLDTGKKTGWLSTAVTYLFRRAGAETRIQKLVLLLSLFTLLVIVRAVIGAMRDVTLVELQTGFVEEIRSKLAQGLVAARWDFVARLRHARTAHLMSSDIQSLSGATSFLLQCTVSLALILSQCVLALFLSPILACIALCLLASGGVALGFIMRRARAHGLFLTDSNLALLNSTAQFLGGIKLAVSQNLQHSFIAEFQRSLTDYSSRQIAYARRRTNANIAATTISSVVAGLTVLVGLGVMDVSPSYLIAMLYLFSRMTAPALQIQQGAQLFAIGLPAYEKIKELEAQLSAASSLVAAVAHATKIPDAPIVFRGVTFSHSHENGSVAAAPVLRNACVTISSGSIVGICGPSGEGKTTFIDLLLGLYPPHSGEILVGDVVLTGAALNAWRDRVSYVTQDAFLFHDTIRRNLSWAAPTSREEDLWSALRVAGADGVVEKMSAGLDTIVGERGTLVSGGERQRLALARAVLRKPHLLVLDEATNALDVASERAILQRLAGLIPRPTIIMIAHRVDSVSLCERVLTLEGGRFVEGRA